MVYVILLETKAPQKDNTLLHEKIKSLGTWMHYFESAWLVQPDNLSTAKDIYDELIPLIDGTKDYILIFKLTRDYYGWLAQKGLDWLKERSF